MGFIVNVLPFGIAHTRSKIMSFNSFPFLIIQDNSFYKTPNRHWLDILQILSHQDYIQFQVVQEVAQYLSFFLLPKSLIIAYSFRLSLLP